MSKKLNVRIYNDGDYIEEMKVLNVGDPETRANGKEYAHYDIPYIKNIFEGKRYFIVNSGGENGYMAYDMDNRAHHSSVITICELLGYTNPPKINDSSEDA